MIKLKPCKKSHYTFKDIMANTAIWMGITMFAYYCIFEATA